MKLNETRLSIINVLTGTLNTRLVASPTDNDGMRSCPDTEIRDKWLRYCFELSTQ